MLISHNLVSGLYRFLGILVPVWQWKAKNIGLANFGNDKGQSIPKSRIDSRICNVTYQPVSTKKARNFIKSGAIQYGMY